MCMHIYILYIGGAAGGGLDQESGSVCTAGAGPGVMRAFNHVLVHAYIRTVRACVHSIIDQERGSVCTAGAGSGVVSSIMRVCMHACIHACMHAYMMHAYINLGRRIRQAYCFYSLVQRFPVASAAVRGVDLLGLTRALEQAADMNPKP